MAEKLYRVRNSETGEYSIGGVRPKWAKKGKRWDSLNSVKLHFAAVRKFWEHHKDPSRYADYLKLAVVVEYEVVEAGTTAGKDIADA